MLLSFKNIYFFKLSILRPRGVRIIGKLFKFVKRLDIEIDRESNIKTELYTSSITANRKQTLIAKNIGNIAAIV